MICKYIKIPWVRLELTSNINCSRTWIYPLYQFEYQGKIYYNYIIKNKIIPRSMRILDLHLLSFENSALFLHEIILLSLMPHLNWQSGLSPTSKWLLESLLAVWGLLIRIVGVPSAEITYIAIGCHNPKRPCT